MRGLTIVIAGTSFSIGAFEVQTYLERIFETKFVHMTKVVKSEKKSGPKDRHYINKDQDYETAYSKKRKQPARKFGKSKGNA